MNSVLDEKINVKITRSNDVVYVVFKFENSDVNLFKEDSYSDGYIFLSYEGYGVRSLGYKIELLDPKFRSKIDFIKNCHTLRELVKIDDKVSEYYIKSLKSHASSTMESNLNYANDILI